MVTISKKIWERSKYYNRERFNLGKEPNLCLANDNISDLIIETRDLERMVDEVTEKFESVLDSLVINTEVDHNTKDTAKRVAKMFINEIFWGRYHPMPDITAFPNGDGNGKAPYDQIYVTGPITVRSTCSHHFMPIVGNCWIGIKPGEKLIGLSKFNRLVDWVASRPQIQEEMTEQIANIIEEQTKPQALAVVIKATHFCMTHRGVREHGGDMATSVMRGDFRNSVDMRQEFLSLMNNMKGHN